MTPIVPGNSAICFMEQRVGSFGPLDFGNGLHSGDEDGNESDESNSIPKKKLNFK